MQDTTLWRQVLGVEKTTIIERVEFDAEDGVVVASVRPSGRMKPRCGRCQRSAIAARRNPHRPARSTKR